MTITSNGNSITPNLINNSSFIMYSNGTQTITGFDPAQPQEDKTMARSLEDIALRLDELAVENPGLTEELMSLQRDVEEHFGDLENLRETIARLNEEVRRRPSDHNPDYQMTRAEYEQQRRRAEMDLRSQMITYNSPAYPRSSMILSGV